VEKNRFLPPQNVNGQYLYRCPEIVWQRVQKDQFRTCHFLTQFFEEGFKHYLHNSWDT
jgi:hypothetical protein